MRPTFVPFLALAAITLSPALAQPADQPNTTPPQPSATDPLPGQSRSRFSSNLELSAEHAFTANLDEGDGEVSVSRVATELSLSYFCTESIITQLSIGAEGVWYNFNDAGNALIPGVDHPFNQMLQVSLAPRVIFRTDGPWSYLVGGSVVCAGEADVDADDALTWGLFGGAQYQVNKNLSIGFGGGVRTRLERSPVLLPFLTLDWQITDRVSLTTKGLGVRLANKINDGATFIVDLQARSPEYRLEDDAPLPDGIVQDTRVPLSFGVVLTPCEHARITLKAGATVYQEFTVYDSEGHRLSQADTRPAPFVSVGVDFAF